MPVKKRPDTREPRFFQKQLLRQRQLAWITGSATLLAAAGLVALHFFRSGRTQAKAKPESFLTALPVGMRVGETVIDTVRQEPGSRSRKAEPLPPAEWAH